MDFEVAKENIQPLASGRNISLLEAALHTDREKKEELATQRKEFEDKIVNYEGDDPLELWYEYIFWVEQCYPNCGKDTALDEVLKRCIRTLETEDQYKQDRRMIKLYIKFIDMQPNQAEYYNFMYNQGIGTMVADFYIGWAYTFELLGNFEKVDEIYERGIACRAMPVEDLKYSFEQYKKIKSTLIVDNESNAEYDANMRERRFALTSLRGHTKKKQVGSIRTGAVVKSHRPGIVNQENLEIKPNVQVNVFQNDDEKPEFEIASSSTAKSVIDSVTNVRENIVEPGPWSKANKNKNKGALFSNEDDLGFAICEDSIDESETGSSLPSDFVRTNEPQTEFLVERLPEGTTLNGLQCDTDLMYPQGTTEEFSFEEILACRYKKYHSMKPSKPLFEVLSILLDGARLPNDFVRSNLPQDDFNTEDHKFEGNSKLMAMCRVLSGKDKDVSYEETLKAKYLKNKKLSETMTNREEEDMEIDQTKISEPEQRRSSEGFKMNETCSTQMFNFFIKPQSISTPNAKKNKMSIPRSSLSLYNHVPKEEKIVETSLENEYLQIQEKSPVDEPPIQPQIPENNMFYDNLGGKQLSVILETTETNSTASGGQATGITKSTVDTRYCTTFNNELTKRQTMDMLSATPRKSCLKKSPEFSTFHDSMMAKNQELNEEPKFSEEDGAVGGPATDQFQFAVPSAVSNSIYRDFDETQEPQRPDFAIPLRPKEKYMLQDSMEHFKKPMPKSKVPLLEKTIDAIEELAPPTRLSYSIAVYQNSGDEDKVKAPELSPEKLDSFAIFHDSAFNEKSMVNRDKKSLVETANRERTRDNFEIQKKESEQEKSFQIFQDSVVSDKLLLSNAKPILLESKIYDENNLGQMPGKTESFAIFQDSVVSDKLLLSNVKPISSEPKTESFAIFQDSHFAEKSMSNNDLKKSVVRHNDIKEGHSSSPLNSYLFSTKKGLDTTCNDLNFLASPPRGDNLNVGNESVMPGIHHARSHFMDNSMTLPSMREVTTTVTMDLKKLAIQPRKSILKKPKCDSPCLDESLTFNALIKKSSMARKEEGSEEKKADLPKMFNESLTFNSILKKGDKSILNLSQKPKEPKENHSLFQIHEDSVVFDSSLLKKKEPEKEKNDFFLSPMRPPQAKPNFQSDSPTFTSILKKEGKSLMQNDIFLSPPQPPQVQKQDSKGKERESVFNANESMTFNSIMKNELSTMNSKPVPVAKISPTNKTVDQSMFSKIMDEIPSSTAHNFNLYVNKNKQELGNELANLKYTPIKKQPPKTFVEEKPCFEDFDGPDMDIYKFENTLRVIPDSDLASTDSWYNQEHGEMFDINKEDDYDPPQIDLTHAEDPFEGKLLNSFLERLDFLNYLESVATCDLRQQIPPLKQNQYTQLGDKKYFVRKLIGKGAFGKIYSAKTDDDELCALKQSKPGNLWEYYICLEVHSRIFEFNPELVSAFIEIEQALVGRNATIFVLPFCKYGNLLNVCNEVKQKTNRNLGEKVVMILTTQLLAIIDALHACQVIHADVKPDNIMVMGPINPNNYNEPILKLIDFGQAIDMKLFAPEVEFKSSLSTAGFTCTEMLEGRPWTYQTDLYCLAGTIHTILLGKYMSVQQGVCGYMITEKIPRYLQKSIWEPIFLNLLNIQDCRSMPNLQGMKLDLKEHLSLCENGTYEEVRKFNQVINAIETLDK